MLEFMAEIPRRGRIAQILFYVAGGFLLDAHDSPGKLALGAEDFERGEDLLEEFAVGMEEAELLDDENGDEHSRGHIRLGADVGDCLTVFAYGFFECEPLLAPGPGRGSFVGGGLILEIIMLHIDDA